MEDKLRLYGFNNLTKALSFNIYDVCYAKTQREQQDYIAYIDEQYNSERLTNILTTLTDMIGATVLNIAKQDYEPQGASVAVLISEGSIGLMKAAEKYDAQRGKPFVTFAAPYIRRSIEEAIRKTTGEVPVLSTDESLPIGSNNNYTLLNVLEDKDAPKTDSKADEGILSEDLIRAVGILNEREQAVVNRYYGLGFDKMTMAEIGQELGFKRERVRQIRDKAVRKLRKHSTL